MAPTGTVTSEGDQACAGSPGGARFKVSGSASWPWTSAAETPNQAKQARGLGTGPRACPQCRRWQPAMCGMMCQDHSHCATPAGGGARGIHGTTIVPTLCRPVPLLMCQNPAELGPEGPYCY